MTDINFSTTVNNSYSQALYELSVEDNVTNEVESEINSILKLITDNLEFKNLIKNPTISQEHQSKAINAIFQKFKINNLLIKFLNFLVSKRRLFFVEKIFKDFLIICSNERGEIIAKLSAAKKLNDNEIEDIKKSLTENFGTNLKLNFKHNPDLVGGLVIQVGSIMIDSSIKNKLQQIENRMLEA